LKYKTNFYLWLKGEIKKKNQFKKRPKNINNFLFKKRKINLIKKPKRKWKWKRMKIKIEIINTNKFFI